MGAPSVAIVHDFLVGRGGAERVALTMAKTFPGAEIHTALFDAQRTFAGFADHDVRPLPIDRLPIVHRHHRATLPILQPAFQRRVIDADVVLCSSSGFAHLIGTTGRKLVYCHTPARWLTDQDRYLQRFGPVTRFAARCLTRPSLGRDRDAMLDADRIVANSHVIKHQLAEQYGADAEVVHPCSSLQVDGPVDPLPGIEPGFVFSPARPLGYKRLDLLVSAARQLPNLTFVQVGEGPDLDRLRAQAPRNLHLLGSVSDARLRWAYRHASIVALTSAEDFGLVPVEAAAHGLMSVVPHARGFLDHVVDGHNGWFYEFGNAEAFAAVIAERIDERAPVPEQDPLGEARFAAELRRLVDEVAA